MITKNRIKTVLTLAIVAMVAIAVSAVQADTNNVLSGDITKAAGWDNGLPTGANPGFIAVDGIITDTTFGYGADAVITQTAGAIVGSGTNGFNWGPFNATNGGGTWNMSGGSFIGRYFLPNGGNSTFNISGGTITLNGSGNGHLGAANGGHLNISGSAVLNATLATAGSEDTGIYDIATGWSGYWTYGIYTGDDWKNFVVAHVTVDDAAVDAATFDGLFVVSGDGKTLSMINDPNLPSVDAGPDMISWSGQAVAMDPNVVNNDTNEPPGTLTYLWTAEPNGIGDPDLDVVITDANQEDPNASVTITKTAPTGNATVVTMTLSVTLEGKSPVTNSMTIAVYDDACLAAMATGSVGFDKTDIDENCITAFPDFALMAMTWLEDYAATEPFVK